MDATKEMKFGTKVTFDDEDDARTSNIRTHSTLHDDVLCSEGNWDMTSVLVTALCYQPEAFASDLGDDQSRYLWSYCVWLQVSAYSLRNYYIVFGNFFVNCFQNQAPAFCCLLHSELKCTISSSRKCITGLGSTTDTITSAFLYRLVGKGATIVFFPFLLRDLWSINSLGPTHPRIMSCLYLCRGYMWNKIILKLFQPSLTSIWYNLPEIAHEYFPACSVSLK